MEYTQWPVCCERRKSQESKSKNNRLELVSGVKRVLQGIAEDVHDKVQTSVENTDLFGWLGSLSLVYVGSGVVVTL